VRIKITISLIILAGAMQLHSQLFNKAFQYSYPKRMLVLDSISTYILKPFRTDSASYYSAVNELRDQADKINDKKALLYADYLLFYFNIYNFKWDDKKVNEVYQELLSRSKKQNAITVEVNLYLNMGYYNDNKKDPNYLLYFDYLHKAYLLYIDLDVKGFTDKVYNLYSLALAYYKFGDYPEAIKYATIVNQLPQVPYVNMFNYNLMGVSYLKLGELDSSRLYLEKTYQLAEELEKKNEFIGWKGIALGNIGHTWYEQADYPKAISYYLKGIKICKEIGFWDNVSPFSSKLISSYVKTGQLQEAEKHFDLARQSTKAYNMVEGYYDFYMAMADYYKAKNYGMQAITYRDSAISYNDSLQKIFDRNLKVQTQLANYNEKTEALEALHRLEKSRENIIRNSIILFAIFLVGAIYYFYYRQRKQLRTKTFLLKEIHHRVKNNLQLISSILDIQQRTLSDEKLMQAFVDAKSRIGSMALLNQNLYEKENIGIIDTQEYFDQLFRVITSSYAQKNVKITNTIQSNAKLTIDSLIPLALIFNELLTNTYKYAFNSRETGDIHFELTQNGESLQMIYTDNGQGFLEGFEWTKSKGLGSLMIRKFTQQLFGTHSVNSNASGVKFIFNFKSVK